LLCQAYTGTFVDIGEHGSLDILVLIANGATLSVKGVWNAFVYDAYFIKALGMRALAKHIALVSRMLAWLQWSLTMCYRIEWYLSDTL
jgi:hypothetical protein